MSSDEVASRLSAKLLQGWCMLDKACDLCNTPIMRDKKKREYCCGCQIFISDPTNENKINSLPAPAQIESVVVSDKVEDKPREDPFVSQRLTLKFTEACESLLDRVIRSNSIDDCGKVAEVIEKLSQAYKQFNLR